MAGSDWVKAHRSMMDSAVWADEWLVKLWMWCLFKANYADATWKGSAIKRGQFVTGRNTAADELHVSPSKWYRGMMRLAELGNIEITANSVWTRVTVCNYSSYQDSTIDKRTAVGQRADSERTADDTTNGQRADTREEEQEGKKGRREEEDTEAIASCSEPSSTTTREPKPAEPIAENFPPVECSGKVKAWRMTAAKLFEWRETFATVDVDAEIRKAIQWLRDNPGRRKTASGMPTFIGRWLTKATNDTGRGGVLPFGNGTHRETADERRARKMMELERDFR